MMAVNEKLEAMMIILPENRTIVAMKIEIIYKGMMMILMIHKIKNNLKLLKMRSTNGMATN